MTRLGALAIAAALTIAASPLAFAGPEHDHEKTAGPSGKVAMGGWFSDEWCGAKNANAKGEGCAKSCIENGAAVVFVSEGKVYKLAKPDQKRAIEHLGHEVVVEGSIGADGVLDLDKIEPAGEA